MNYVEATGTKQKCRTVNSLIMHPSGSSPGVFDEEQSGLENLGFLITNLLITKY